MSLNARYVFAELKCVSGLLSAWILASPKIWNDPQWHWISGMQVKIAVRYMDAAALH